MENNFEQFELPEPLLKALKDLNFSQPTPIQAKTLPIALGGKDLIATAETGSGKTAAFCLPILAKLNADQNANALILAPTRELALQTENVIKDLNKYLPSVRVVLLIGGTSMVPQVRNLRRNPRIVVATPGRLIDHLERGTIHLDAASFLVLDEADRMLDMGFAPQLEEILPHLPAERQTLLFSATFPPEAQRLAGKYLKTPERITVGQVAKPVAKIQQRIVATNSQGKNQALLDEINKQSSSIIIFTRTKRRTDRVADFLDGQGLEVALIHGDRSQSQRKQAIQGFRDGRFRILVATDIAARGLDIPQIGLVINYDLPDMVEDYVHRIGRTARAGASGEAVSILTNEDFSQWRRITKVCKMENEVHLKVGGHASDEKRFGKKPSFQRRDSRRDGRGGGRGEGRGQNRGPRHSDRSESGSEERFSRPRESRDEARGFEGRREGGDRRGSRRRTWGAKSDMSARSFTGRSESGASHEGQRSRGRDFRNSRENKRGKFPEQSGKPANSRWRKDRGAQAST